MAAFCCLPVLPLAAAEPPVPVLVVPAPHLDAGTVTNRYLTHAFTLCNAGTAPLLITRVRACCGATCLLTATDLPPGTVAKARVRIDLGGRSGDFRKTIYLHTSDPARPVAAVRLSGRIASPPGGTGDFDAAVWDRALRTGP